MRASSRQRALLLAASFAIAPACSPADSAAPDPPNPRGWSALATKLDRVPLAVWGSAADDAWIAGGGLAAGKPTLLLHYDGAALAEAFPAGDAPTSPPTATLWWVHGTAGDDVWAVGDAGNALHYDGAAWSRVATPTTATIYGVWAASRTEAWAVGGTPGGGGPNDVLLRWDGASWQSVGPPKELGATYFKVWGASASDVHVVGKDGVALHYDGSSWSIAATGTTATLFTVHGAAGRVLAIGGAPSVLLAWEAGAWTKAVIPPQMSGAMSGVFVDASGTTFLAGERHQRYRIDAGGLYTDDSEAEPATGDFHSVWGDGRGGALAVGGNYVVLTKAGTAPSGVVARFVP